MKKRGRRRKEEKRVRKKLEQLQVHSHFYIEKQLKAKRESRQKRAAKVQYTEDIWLK